MRDKIVISIPSMWSIRNFLYSSFKDTAEKKYDVYYLIPDVEPVIQFAKSFNLTNVIVYPVVEYSLKEVILYQALRYKSLFGFKMKVNRDFFSKYFKTQRNIRKILINIFAFTIALIMPLKQIFALLIRYSKVIKYKKSLGVLKEINPKIVLATNHILKYEMKYFLALKSEGIKSSLFVNSFDNLTTRGILPINFFDAYYVWNSKMKRELIRIYNLPSEIIFKVGTPQFDVLLEGVKTKVSSEDELFLRIQNRKYVVYATGHFSLLPNEPKLVKFLLKVFREANFLTDFLFVIRPHPMEDYRRWVDFSLLDGVLVDFPWEQNHANPNWAIPSAYEFKRLGLLLSNASLVYNIASTVSLDCCVLDTPVINVCFGINKQDDALVRNYYTLEHYKDIVESKCSVLVRNPDELMEETKRVINDPQLNSSPREEVRLNFCNRIAGESSKVILDSF